MANTVLTASIIAKEAIIHLENNLVMSGLVHRAVEEEYQKSVNGYKPGATVTIRKPAQFTVRSGAVATSQDVVEGSTSITIDKQKGVDFEFTSADLTLKIEELGERVIKPAMIRLGNEVDMDVMNLYRDVPNWIGQPGQLIDSFTDFYKGPERLNEFAVPTDQRAAVLSPSDEAGLISNFSGLHIEGTAKTALEKAKLPMIGGVNAYMSQNVPTHVTGNFAGTPLVNGAGQAVAYTAVKDTGVQTLNVDGFGASTTNAVRPGDVFEIAGVYAVNPITKAPLPFLQQFTVVAGANSDGSGAAALAIRPAIITTGAFQTVTAAAADNAALTFKGQPNTGYRQNMTFHKNAFALAMAPMVAPPGAVKVSRQSYKGVSVRVIPFYDGTNDVSRWRLDVLYGVKTLDERLATRQSGTA